MKWKWTDDDKTLLRTSRWINGALFIEAFVFFFWKQMKQSGSSELWTHWMHPSLSSSDVLMWKFLTRRSKRHQQNAVHKLFSRFRMRTRTQRLSDVGDDRFIEMPGKVFNARTSTLNGRTVRRGPLMYGFDKILQCGEWKSIGIGMPFARLWNAN